MRSDKLPGWTGRIHFIGIGGIGMSGIAEVLLNLGFEVSGSDMEESRITARLADLGARISRGHDAANIGDAETVVVSSAIKPDNPEVLEAKRRGIPLIPRSDMLGELMRVRRSIAVAGAHGKTTTTSLAALVMQKAGLDPTIVVGGKVKSLDANAMLGAGEYLVAEVDESDGNFVRLSPAIALITNIDAEHLDFYGGLEKIQDAFLTFANRVPFNGLVICCSDDGNIRSIMPSIDRRVITYGFGSEAEFRGRVIEEGPEGTRFSVETETGPAAEYFLRVPGRHNALNAVGVCALAGEIGIESAHIAAAFEEYEGLARRFERRGEAGGVLVVDDYGHHPTEIEAVVETARRNFDRRLVVVFQPHRYSRTRDIHSSFDRCFRAADEVYVTSVYGAGETPIPGVTGELIYRAARKGGVRKITYIPDRGDLLKALLASTGPGDLVLTLGAGDIWKIGDELLAGKGIER